MYNTQERIIIAQANLARSIEAVAFWSDHPAHLKVAKRAVKRDRKILAKLIK